MPSTSRPVSRRPSGRVGTETGRARTPLRTPGVAGSAAVAEASAGPDSAPDTAAIEQRARTPLTGRAAILAVVLLVLVLSFAYPFRGWFDQRAQISELQERTIAQQQKIAELSVTLERWDDPAYVETVARERLRFVMPGEASFVVLGGGDPRDSSALVAQEAGGDWWEQLWTTVAAADDPALSPDAAVPDTVQTPAADPSTAPSTSAPVLPTP